MIGIETETGSDVHLPGAVSDYDTLCGMDADDAAIGHSRFTIRIGSKCTCSDCLSIWSVSSKYSRRHFDMKILP